MRNWVLASALAALTCGGVAFANDQYGNQGSYGSQPSQGSSSINRQQGRGGSGMDYTATEPTALPPVVVRHEKQSSLAVTAGAGIEGFWGSTRDLVAPGLGWGATVMGKPIRELGIELGYSGAIHEVREGTAGSYGAGPNLASGADIVRDGVNLALTVGPPWKVQPYLLGGYGLNWYTARGATTLVGFRNDMGGAFPVGAGIRTDAGHFMADLRVDYNIGVGENFAPVASSNADRYQGMLQLGARF